MKGLPTQMNGLEKVFSSDWWAKVQMRLDDNPSSNIVSPPNLIRTIAGGMHPSHRFFDVEMVLNQKR